jgi:hypothetical protein
MISSHQNLTHYVMHSLKNLSPAELHKLERAITPDIAFLLTKAFGPEMGVLTWPLIANDDMDDDGTDLESGYGPHEYCTSCQ